ncbi:DUF2796 domain-containing protein [Seohaeicola saemankumensis]|nr:DUF2796 domain-containing protein [Seohaeicola saemankumensis]MCA0873078.1 DUF2796 domain-containing protein [Seohaeicola saemankumensis]
MKPLGLAALALVAAAPVSAQETREMDAHEHGVSTLELAIEHGKVEMNLTSPGADIVGFEYAASSDADKDTVEAAIRMMLLPENIVTLPKAAECRLTEVLAHLHTGDDDHADHEDGHDDHDDHAEGDDHADHDDHADGDDHDHDGGGEHSEFHVRYKFACEHAEKLTAITFPFFEQFTNAQEIEALFVTETGAGAAEIDRAAPELKLN